ncbi:hypothetical protein [Alteromonas gracilis]
MNISSSLSLLDYLNNPEKGRTFLESQTSRALGSGWPAGRDFAVFFTY